MNLSTLLLKDDATANGGKSHSMETLGEFLENDSAIIESAKQLESINNDLVSCGILPIIKSNYDVDFEYIENLKVLERYQTAFKENEQKKRELIEQNKGLLAEIIKIQNTLIKYNEVL